MVIGDGISQFFVEKHPIHQYDTSRGLRFFLFGTVLGVMYISYNCVDYTAIYVKCYYITLR